MTEQELEQLMEVRNEVSDLLGAHFYTDHQTLESAKEELELIEGLLETVLDMLDKIMFPGIDLKAIAASKVVQKQEP